MAFQGKFFHYSGMIPLQTLYKDVTTSQDGLILATLCGCQCVMGKVKFWSMKWEKEQSLHYEQESQPNKPRVYLIEGSQYSHVNSVANSKQER